MKLSFFSLFLLILPFSVNGICQEPRTVIDLNGTWDFEQTEKAFPPQKFTRRIQVPGLIFLAQPRIDQLENYYQGSYKPRYNWYRKSFFVSPDLKNLNAVLTILKSKYVTQAYLNGIELGQSISCYTPIEFPAAHAVRYGEENELLLCLGDRKRLPSSAAGSTDKEKVTYWPGIWDDVYLSFTGPFRIKSALLLPSVNQRKVTAKVLIRGFYPAQIQYGDRMQDTCQVEIAIREKKSGKPAGTPVVDTEIVKRDNLTQTVIEIPMENAHLWTPDDPFLYTAAIVLRDDNKGLSDKIELHFGMRDFSRKGKHFSLNGQEIILRGTNITLHRFFEDPGCKDLPWNQEWVKKLLHEIPKKLQWNAMRICVGIAPKLWYDIADESGLLVQNEWLYWQNHGWDDQIRAEYTDWVWADGNHPSIVIWDAINENRDPFIGNVLIPELKILDPTRIWDAGYMTSEHMTLDEMDEPHPYMVYGHREDLKETLDRSPYPLGDLHYWPEDRRSILTSSAAQLVNEYGWIWLWRDGRPAKLTANTFAYYLGEKATAEERRELQAYWVQLQTEWLRTERSLAGVLAFCYLTNDFGFTGDWFVGPIAALNLGPALKWFRHCFAPAAVFIDLVDGRYTRHVPPREPGSQLVFNMVGVNDHPQEVSGRVVLRLLNSGGKESQRKTLTVTIPAYEKQYIPASLTLPQAGGGYLLLAEFIAEGADEKSPVISRRYLRVGGAERYEFFDYKPGW
ncbi:MAG TPA: glycoside hydrolase family 2 TIM barrel-domain containing protein [archaeon]|nr:glycoside hydrolase family 2 TIM barrel-domain containing protein [archaeon]